MNFLAPEGRLSSPPVVESVIESPRSAVRKAFIDRSNDFIESLLVILISDGVEVEAVPNESANLESPLRSAGEFGVVHQIDTESLSCLDVSGLTPNSEGSSSSVFLSVSSCIVSDVRGVVKVIAALLPFLKSVKSGGGRRDGREEGSLSGTIVVHVSMMKGDIDVVCIIASVVPAGCSHDGHELFWCDSPSSGNEEGADDDGFHETLKIGRAHV